MSNMPQGYPREFRDDVVAVAQRREAGVTVEQIAEDFGICEGCSQNWLRQAEIEAGKRPRTTSAVLRELRNRNRLLEQDNEMLRRAAAYLSQANLPGKGSTRS